MIEEGNSSCSTFTFLFLFSNSIRRTMRMKRWTYYPKVQQQKQLDFAVGIIRSWQTVGGPWNNGRWLGASDSSWPNFLSPHSYYLLNNRDIYIIYEPKKLTHNFSVCDFLNGLPNAIYNRCARIIRSLQRGYGNYSNQLVLIKKSG